MSREQELSYSEIARLLGISVKTVETQMGRALKALRAQLADYLSLALTVAASWAP
jgi:RNA polymerase sigma-70 factor (ECF subfamily)